MSKPEMVRSKPQLKIWNEGVCICSLKLSEVKHNCETRAGTSLTVMWNSCFLHMQVLKLLNKTKRCQTSMLWLLCSELCSIVYLVTFVTAAVSFYKQFQIKFDCHSFSHPYTSCTITNFCLQRTCESPAFDWIVSFYFQNGLH